MAEPHLENIKSPIRSDDFLRKARLEAGLSQGNVARKLGYRSPQIVSNWERGLCQPPTKKMLQLCRLYKLKPEHLFEAHVKEFAYCLEKALRKRKYLEFIAAKILDRAYRMKN